MVPYYRQFFRPFRSIKNCRKFFYIGKETKIFVIVRKINHKENNDFDKNLPFSVVIYKDYELLFF